MYKLRADCRECGGHIPRIDFFPRTFRVERTTNEKKSNRIYVEIFLVRGSQVGEDEATGKIYQSVHVPAILGILKRVKFFVLENTILVR